MPEEVVAIFAYLYCDMSNNNGHWTQKSPRRQLSELNEARDSLMTS